MSPRPTTRPSSRWPPVDTALADVIEGDERERITSLVSSLNFARIEAFAASLRDSPTGCTVNQEKYTWGTAYVVFELIFDDGIVWIIRLRMRERSETLTSVAGIGRMDSEVATLRYLHQTTSIPVPVVISYSTSTTQSPLGVGTPPFMLMTAIMGYTLQDLGIYLTNPEMTYDDSQLVVLKRFMTQLAAIHLELSHVTFPEIGSLHNSPDGGTFLIGPCTRTGKGPFSTARAYFESQAEAFIHLAGSQPEDSDLARKQRTFVAHMWRDAVLSLVHAQDDAGPFPLHHPDLHDENILIDKEGNILSILDWDAASTVPIEEFAVPSIQCTDFLPSAANNFHERNRHLLFSEALRALEVSLSPTLPPSGRTWSELHNSLAGYVAYFMAYWMWSMECDYNVVGRFLFTALQANADSEMDDSFRAWDGGI